MGMKRTCHGCRAMSRQSGYGCICQLGYPVEANKYHPLAECPKPRTIGVFEGQMRKKRAMKRGA